MISVRIPATSANLGPGFDALGIAVSLYATVSIEETPSGLEITGAEPCYSGADNLVNVAYRAAMEYMHIPVAGVRIHIQSDIPVSRGLGSSAALYAGGALCASLLHGGRLTKDELLLVTNALEGHPDNLAPAIYGGLTTAMVHGGIPYAVSMPISPAVRLCALVPEYRTSTHEAREALPKLVSHADAAYTAAHACAMLAALSSGDPAAIARASDDRLHEPFRKKLIPGFDEVKQAMLNAGATAFVISGSGSTCMCVYVADNGDAAFTERAKKAAAALPGGWRVLPLDVDYAGARAV